MNRKNGIYENRHCRNSPARAGLRRLSTRRPWVTYQSKKKITLILVLVILSGMFAVYAQRKENKAVFSVRDFGAKGDNKTKDTRAIQKALDECYKVGGGIVRLPKGKYLSGSIFIKSKTTLLIEKGAILEGSKDFDDYPLRSLLFDGIETKKYRAREGVLFRVRPNKVSHRINQHHAIS